MKIFLLFSTLLAIGQANYSELLKQEWNTYKLQHGKQYFSPLEEEFRMKVFIETKEQIAKHNEVFARGEVTYDMGLNEYSDLTDEEFATMMTGRRPALTRSIYVQYSTDVDNVTLPTSVDWRQKGAVTPVKNQGSCGSCWAFSATGALEGQHFIKTGQLVSLSEQNLMDCSKNDGNNGCSGGDMAAAFKYIISNGGVDTEASYPYEAKNGQCRFNAQTVGAKASTYVNIKSGDQNSLKQAIANVGPVSVAMYASLSAFKSYKSGIFYNAQCSNSYSTLDHGVLAVGYGSADGTDYWIVKNSWGTSWGESGYFRISLQDNNCGLATDAVYPLV